MKHSPVVITFESLLERTADSFIGERVAEDLNLGRIAPHDSHCFCFGEPDEIERCDGYHIYTQRDLNTHIEVSWPDGVRWPAFDEDAYYEITTEPLTEEDL